MNFRHHVLDRALLIVLIMWIAFNTAQDMATHGLLHQRLEEINATRFTHQDGLVLKQELLTRIERLNPGYLGTRQKGNE